MAIRLLGAVEICLEDRVIPVGPPQRCAVFAALAVDAGRLVPVDTLIDRVWGAEPPPHARRTLHTHLTRIRRLLEQSGIVAELAHRCGGYALDLRTDLVDLHRFVGLVERAHEAGRTDGDRVVLLREALDLWRGEPLLGIQGTWTEQVRRAWQQRHLDAVLSWARAEMRCGDPAVVVGRLAELAELHPLCEPVMSTLIQALAGAGRTADALACYLQFRCRLVEELGVDPGPELRDQYQALLRGTASAPRPPRNGHPRTFFLQRSTGAGSSRVADGVLWPDGSASVHWNRFDEAATTDLGGRAARIVWLD